MQEGRNGVTQMVSYPGYPWLSGKVNFLSGDSLAPCVVVLLVAVSYSCHTYVYSGWMPSVMDALAIRNLMSSTHTTIKKLNVGHLHYKVTKR